MTIKQITSLSQSYRSELQSFAYHMTHDIDRAQDLLQEVNYQVIKNRNSFQPGTNFPAWVKRIIRNTFISDYRRTKRRARIIDQNRMPAGWFQKTSVPNMGERLLEEEDVNVLLSHLPKVHRQAFCLYCHGLSYQEIAVRSRVPIGTIKSRIFAARCLLKKQLGQRGIFA
jgi:RNA polymerase sigma-70 factor (ECF subfamily)